jgi:two-component system OmpR family sensor kinase
MLAVMRSVPLRVKLVAAVLALVTAALVVISASSAFFLRRYLIEQVDADLRTTSDGVWDAFATPGGGQVPIPGDYFVVAADSRGIQSPVYAKAVVSSDDLPALPDGQSDFSSHIDVPYDARAIGSIDRWRVLVTAQPDGRMLMVGRNLADVDHTVKQLLWIDVLAGGAVLIVLASAGAAVVRASLKPLRDIERTAGAIAAGDLSQRVPDPEPGVEEPKTEVGRLSRAFNTMLTQIESAFTARADSETAARDAAFAAQASETRARRSEERMRQFVADASHELRTPLTTIRGFAELYRQGAAGPPEDTARLVRRIEDEAARMGLLVEDLLLLARLDRERPVALAPVELRVLATEAVQAAKAVAPDRVVALEVARDAGPLVVLGDDARLRQVLGNLVSNALMHTPPEADISVRMRAEGGSAVIEVADTGPGLSPQQRDRVFERFYRVDAARTRHDGTTSTGLGLAIVSALVSAHGGTVEVDSETGVGATFRVLLPLAPQTDDPENEGDVSEPDDVAE